MSPFGFRIPLWVQLVCGTNQAMAVKKLVLRNAQVPSWMGVVLRNKVWARAPLFCHLC